MPRPWRSGTSATSGSSSSPAAAISESRAGPSTNGRSPGRTSIAPTLSAMARSRASSTAQLRPRPFCGSARAPAATARSSVAGSGLTTTTESTRPAARAAAIVRARSRVTRSRRSSASRAWPRRDFASSRPRSGITTMSRGGGSPMTGRGSVTAQARTARPKREDLAGEPLARRVVGHDGVGDERLHPERLHRGASAASSVSSTNPSTSPWYSRATPSAVDSWPRLHEHPVGRALERLAADDRADRQDRRPAAFARPRARSRTPRTARIGPIETMGFDGAMTIVSREAELAPDARRRLRAVDAVEADLVHLGRLVLVDEVLLELEPAVVGADLRAHRVVAHRQDRGDDAERRAGGRGRPRSGARRP